LVFVPVFFLSGLQGRLFAPLGYAYVLAVLVSLVIALTLTPALALVFLPGAGGATEPPLVRWLGRVYRHLLRRLDREFPLVLTVTVLLLAAAGVALVGLLGHGEFLPELRENHFVVHVAGTPGTSLAQSMTSGQQLTRRLLEIGAVRSVCQQAGR